jgi:putative transposase
MYPVRLMCRCLNVSPSGFYAWRQRGESARSRDNRRLLARIKEIYDESDGVYGSPRIHGELRYEGETCSKKRVARLMQLRGIKGIPQRRKWQKKTSGRRPDGIENHLKRQFNADGPNMKWVTDITYIRTGEGWLYLVIVIDLHTREVVGWSMSHKQDKQLVLQAVLMALWQRQSDEMVILHSDRGTQFTSDEYQRFLRSRGIISSMSAVGSCADNAAAESFFGVLKRERVNRRRYATRAEARSDIFDYIERFHNPAKRRKITASKPDKTFLTQPSTETR